MYLNVQYIVKEYQISHRLLSTKPSNNHSPVQTNTDYSWGLTSAFSVVFHHLRSTFCLTQSPFIPTFGLSIHLFDKTTGGTSNFYRNISMLLFPISHGIHWGFLWWKPIAQELGEMNGFSQHPQQQDELKTSGHTVHMHVVYLNTYYIYIYMCVCVILIGKLNNWLTK